MPSTKDYYTKNKGNKKVVDTALQKKPVVQPIVKKTIPKSIAKPPQKVIEKKVVKLEDKALQVKKHVQKPIIKEVKPMAEPIKIEKLVAPAVVKVEEKPIVKNIEAVKSVEAPSLEIEDNDNNDEMGAFFNSWINKKMSGPAKKLNDAISKMFAWIEENEKQITAKKKEIFDDLQDSIQDFQNTVKSCVDGLANIDKKINDREKIVDEKYTSLQKKLDTEIAKRKGIIEYFKNAPLD